MEIGHIKKRPINEEMKKSYLAYAMSVIISRALPDVRDGLKPVHRRILYAMRRMGLHSSAKFRKSATIVGETLGKYHPHGDAAVYESMVKMAQEFHSRYPLVKGQGNFGCFTKDTKVKLTDGRDLTFEELIKESKKGKRNWTFSFNFKNKEIEVAEIKNPRLIRKNEKIIEITLDNRKKIRCTLDHLFMVRNGSYKKAKDLKPSDSLMPLYDKIYQGKDVNLKGYATVCQPFKHKWDFVHRLADKWNLANKVYEKNNGRVRHHLDFNKLNNNPDNILRIQWGEHWQNPSYKKRVIRSKILGFVYSLLGKYKRLSPEIYEQERTNNGIPKFENALNYFDSFSEIVVESKKYNHRVVAVRILHKKEDVYDLTIKPHHNFSLGAGIFVHNSMDNDPAAAPRYTEAKMTKIADEMLGDIDKETVDWVDNYDGTIKEPSVLPAKLPQLLLNGGMGIAVGMATNIPPHNLSELIDGIIYLIDNPKATVKELFQFIKGPDFPTGGEIYNKQGMIEAYSVGRGPIVCRAKAEIIEKKAGKFQIIITEMTYGVNKANLIIKIADLVRSKKLQGINTKEFRDESDKDGVRIVIGLKNDAQPQKVLNRLFKLTDLQKTFHLNMLALVDGIQPQVLSLRGVLEEYIKHRQTVVTRRTQFDLKQAKERAHILMGLNKALDCIDAVIKTIKSSADKETARKNLIKKFKFSVRQTEAILEMRLQALAGLERKKIKDELREKEKIIKALEALLKSPKKIMAVVKDELKELKEKYADKRRTKVFSRPVGQLTEEELIPEEKCVIILTKGGYIKRINPQTYKSQKRGGKGVVGITPREEDAVGHFIFASTHDNILFFTDQGRVFQTKAYEIPETSRVARGQAIVNILQLGAREKIATVFDVAESAQGQYLVMVTKNGIIKRTKIEDFKNVRRSGLLAIKLGKDDKLKWSELTSGKNEIILITAEGQSIRFKEGDIRAMGRTAAGVRGIRLKKGDKLVGMGIIGDKTEQKELKVLVITENGFGKKTDLKYYKAQKRGGTGIKTAKINEKTGNIAASHVLNPETEDLIVISKKGQVIRMQLKSIPLLGRATQGVKIMKLNKSDKVVTTVCL